MNIICGTEDGGKRAWTHGLWRVLRLGLLVYVTLLILACTMAERLIHHPPSPSYDDSEDCFVRMGDVAGFYVEPSRPSQPVLLWSHGNAEDAGQVLSVLNYVTDLGCGALVYDYPGYGLTPGKPSEKGCYQAAEAAFDFLTKTKGIDPQRIIITGQSVGSSAATWLASQKEAGGLILISPFKSAFRVVTGARILPTDPYSNLAKIGKVNEPLLIIHGDEDEVIGYEHGRTLYERANEPKEFFTVKGGHHNDLWVDHRKEVIAEIGRFLEKVKATP